MATLDKYDTYTFSMGGKHTWTWTERTQWKFITLKNGMKYVKLNPWDTGLCKMVMEPFVSDDDTNSLKMNTMPGYNELLRLRNAAHAAAYADAQQSKSDEAERSKAAMMRALFASSSAEVDKEPTTLSKRKYRPPPKSYSQKRRSAMHDQPDDDEVSNVRYAAGVPLDIEVSIGDTTHTLELLAPQTSDKDVLAVCVDEQGTNIQLAIEFIRSMGISGTAAVKRPYRRRTAEAKEQPLRKQYPACYESLEAQPDGHVSDESGAESAAAGGAFDHE